MKRGLGVNDSGTTCRKKKNQGSQVTHTVRTLREHTKSWLSARLRAHMPAPRRADLTPFQVLRRCSQWGERGQRCHGVVSACRTPACARHRKAAAPKDRS